MDDNKMKVVLKGIYDSLTDEQKERAKACKTEQELLDLAGEVGVELPDDLAESVSGGCSSDVRKTCNKCPAWYL